MQTSHVTSAADHSEGKQKEEADPFGLASFGHMERDSNHQMQRSGGALPAVSTLKGTDPSMTLRFALGRSE